MFKLNKKGYSFVELLLSLSIIGIFMIVFISANGYILRVYNNNKSQSEINNIIEITYYELKFNSFFLREASESQVVYINKMSVDSIIQEDIDDLFVKTTDEREFFLINIDCDYDEFVNKVKVEFYWESNLKWEKIIYVPKYQT